MGTEIHRILQGAPEARKHDKKCRNYGVESPVRKTNKPGLQRRADAAPRTGHREYQTGSCLE